MTNINPIEGKNLELEVVNKLKSTRWKDLSTGFYYRDLLSDAPKEIDIIARASFSTGSESFRVLTTLIFEVKYLTGSFTVWLDQPKKDDIVSFAKSNLSDAEKWAIRFSGTKFFNFSEIVRTWFQNTQSKKEGFYDAVNNLSKIISKQGIRKIFTNQEDLAYSKKHIIFPIIIYRSENPVEFRNLNNEIIREHDPNFILEIHHIHPNKMSPTNYINDINYIFVWHADSIENNLSNLLKEFYTYDHDDWFPYNLMHIIIDEYNEKYK